MIDIAREMNMDWFFRSRRAGAMPRRYPSNGVSRPMTSARFYILVEKADAATTTKHFLMKATPLWILLLSLCIAAPPLHSAAPKLEPERVVLKVLKVFTAQDGEHLFQAYLVEYKGQEVIVDDRLVKTKYRANDDITVLVMRHPHPDGKVEHGLLHFTIVPPRPR